MACTVEFCISSIVDQDDEAFELLLQKLNQEITANRKSKSILKFNWVFDIPVFCTLCNNPGFIIKTREFRRQLQNVNNVCRKPCLGHKFTVVDLAKTLKFEDCSKELQKMYATDDIDTHKSDDFDIFAAVLNLGKLYKALIDYDVILNTVKRLSGNGFDICARGPCGRSVLHEAIKHTYNYEMFETIFSLGGDVNSADDFAMTAFSSFVFKAPYYRITSLEVVRILKLFLYQNPSLSANLDVMKKAIKYDRVKLADIFVGTNEFRDDHTTDRLALQDELRFVPWLYKCGFIISQSDRDEAGISDFNNTVTYSLRCDCPRQLKEIARISIRSAYTGRKLHNIINSLQLPSSFRNYILMKELTC